MIIMTEAKTVTPTATALLSRVCTGTRVWCVVDIDRLLPAEVRAQNLLSTQTQDSLSPPPTSPC